MNIITEKELQGRLVDGINTLLNLSEEDFNYVIEQLQPDKEFLDRINFCYTTDDYEGPESIIQIGLEKEKDNEGRDIRKCYICKERYSIREILKELETQLSNFTQDSPQYIRIKKLLDSRNLESFKLRYLNENKSNIHIIDKVFEILSDKEVFEKFIDFENNIEYFSQDGREISQKEYLQCLGTIFGNRNKDGTLENKNSISTDFYIPELDIYKEYYSQLLDKINMDRYINPYYEFRFRPKIVEKVIRKGDEPTWKINPKLYKEVYSNMPENLSLEEQAMHIYCSLCKNFSYDEGYLYRDKITKVNYSETFSKEHLESLVPGDKITCYDFARIFNNFINELDGDIEAVIISEGANEGHFYSGFYTDKVSAELEPVNISGTKDPTNDLMRAKTRINLRGIRTISDKEGLLEKALSKVYPQILGKEPLTIKDFLNELKQIPREEIPNDIETKLQSFLETMKKNNISGNEFVQTFEGVRRSSFFGTQLECAYLGEYENENSKARYKRNLLVREKTTEIQDEEIDTKVLYLIDSDSLELSKCTKEEIITQLNSGKFIYESKNHKMPGIDKEVSE